MASVVIVDKLDRVELDRVPCNPPRPDRTCQASCDVQELRNTFERDPCKQTITNDLSGKNFFMYMYYAGTFHIRRFVNKAHRIYSAFDFWTFVKRQNITHCCDPQKVLPYLNKKVEASSTILGALAKTRGKI